jgi:hypothetical protein
MDLIMAVCAGVALAAACGFRVFLPLLALGVGTATGAVNPGESMRWVGSTPALVGFGVATALEVGAYYIPWLDHALDTISSPGAIAAGVLAAAAVLPETHPVVKWTAAVIAGGGSAGVVQAGTVLTRAVSGATTGGLGNPVVATLELVCSIVLAVLAIVVPILAALLVIWAFVWAGRAMLRWTKRRRKLQPVAVAT